MDYLKWRGDLTFSQDAFNEVDNLLLSFVAYVNLEGLSVGAGEERVTLEELSRRFFVLHSEEELAADKSFTRLAPYIVKMMAQSNRYHRSFQIMSIWLIHSWSFNFLPCSLILWMAQKIFASGERMTILWHGKRTLI